MSRTLNFAHQLFDMGRNLQQLGQNHAAASLFSRLASFGELPSGLAEDTQRCLVELYLKNGKYKTARRRLAAILAVQPDNAAFHHLMAQAIEEDEDCTSRRALPHYRRCTKLDPTNPTYLVDLGLCALSEGETTEGLKSLRRAAALAPDDPDVLREVVRGLRYEDALEEAKRLLQCALFRNPRSQAIRALWSQHHFELLSMGQQAKAQASKSPKKQAPIFLPFTRPAEEEIETDNKRIRRDPPSGTPAPKQPARRRLSGKKKV